MWFPLVLGSGILTVMLTWWRGREVLSRELRTSGVPLDQFLDSLFRNPPPRVPGTAVFLTRVPNAVPHALMHNPYHNNVLHERVVFLTVKIKDVAWVPFEERVSIEPLGHGCLRLTLYFGFMNQPDVSHALAELCKEQGLEFNMMQTSFFLSRETVVPVMSKESGMSHWRERLFAVTARNAGSKEQYYNIPAKRVVELGTQIEI
ncbi:MAG TPA: KUP/HAK/KT family potassium transporter [Gammaproteobacteria bacterium]|nr:KUP/HAK/KT family potassium transporter [Gammaproteobacteria bacterium]